MTQTIAVIGALEKEIALILESLEDSSCEHVAGLDIYRGTLPATGDTIVATVAGMGTVNAAATTQLLISQYQASHVIFSGIAGGLNKLLHIGDVVIGQTLRYLDTDTSLIAESAPAMEEFHTSLKLMTLAVQVLTQQGYQSIPYTMRNSGEIESSASDFVHDENRPAFLTGVIATGNRFVTGASMREDALAQTQADCVEMEGAAIAHVCAKNDVPCLIMRAISDNCDEAYDAFCEREFDLDSYARNASETVLQILARL